ncbi:MAG: hypothetical protein IKG98_09705 [Ruminococcus sp.]|nr:hypothetical protein [Ruminococcus sp.]
MNNKFKTAFCLVIAHCAAATANFIFLLGTGEDSPLKWVFLAVTLLYLGVWAWFTARTRKPLVTAVVFAVLLALSVIGVVIAQFSLLADWFIPFAVLLWSPLAGLGAVFSSDVLVWISAAVISAAMIAFGVVRMKKLKGGSD